MTSGGTVHAVRFATGEVVDYRVPGGGWRPGVVMAHVLWGDSAITVGPLTGDRSQVLQIKVTDGTLRKPKNLRAQAWRYDARNHVQPRHRALAPVFIEGPPPAADFDGEDSRLAA
jgi:hypothetical protein